MMGFTVVIAIYSYQLVRLSKKGADAGVVVGPEAPDAEARLAGQAREQTPVCLIREVSWPEGDELPAEPKRRLTPP